MKPSIVVLLIMTWQIGHAAESPWDDARREFEKDLRADSLADQMAAVQHLNGQDHLQAAEFIVRQLKSRRVSDAVKRHIAEALSKFRSPDVHTFMATLLKKRSCPEFVFYAGSMMALQDCRKLHRDNLQELSNEVRKLPCFTMSIRALGYYPDPSDDDIKRLTELLKQDHRSSVRKAACDALGMIPRSDVLPALVGQVNDVVLGKWARRSLRRLTGVDHGRDPAAWRKWIAGQNDLKLLSPRGEARKVEDAPVPEEHAHSSPSFYNVRVTGRRLVFILDRSGSMNLSAGSSRNRRITRLKDELIQMLDAMNKDTIPYHLALLFFAGNRMYPHRTLTEVDAAMIERAKEKIEKVSAQGATPMHHALEYFFETILEREDVDTIYLLSDGEPTDAKADEILSLVARHNYIHQVTINAISIGQESELLKQLADGNNGNYTTED